MSGQSMLIEKKNLEIKPIPMLRFFITCAKCDWLDEKHVVFGKVIDEESLLVLRKIENIPVGAGNKPKLPVAIEQCGEL